MGKVWIIVLVSVLLPMFFPDKCISMTTSNFTDQSALLAFKAHITFDPPNILAHNWSSKTSFCDWIGISCNVRGQRVTALNLPDMGLIGTIPPQLGNLSFPQFLNISNDSFHGYLPSEIGNLHRLKSIDVQANNFTGLIPESFGNLSNVQLVTLATNSLTGI
jgi:LRR receptor-like serine/threonine-protein kinase FLS2